MKIIFQTIIFKFYVNLPGCIQSNISNVVLSGQVNQYFACESQHQHGALDMTADQPGG